MNNVDGEWLQGKFPRLLQISPQIRIPQEMARHRYATYKEVREIHIHSNISLKSKEPNKKVSPLSHKRLNEW